MSYDFLYEVSEGVATLTFNRPEVMNALTFDVYAQLRDLFERLRYDEAVRAIVLTGAGDNFCSGGDVHEIIGELLKRDMKGHIATGDRGCTGASVRLQYIAVDFYLALAQLAEIGHCSQAAADQPLDLLRAAALPAAGRLAVGARRRRTRQHPVFRGDPALAGIAQKRRHPLLD